MKNRYLQGAYVCGATSAGSTSRSGNAWTFGIAGMLALLIALPYVEGGSRRHAKRTRSSATRLTRRRRSR